MPETNGNSAAKTINKWPTHRARVAALTRDRDDDDPELVAARRSLYVALFERYAEEAAEKAPLTAAQANKICRLIQRGTRG